MKQPFSRRIATAVSINTQFTVAVILGVVAWAIWPETAQWWGLGIMSVMFALASALCLKGAIAGMVRVYEHDRAIAEFAALGPEPKSSQVASRDQMKQAGMLDG